MGYVEWRAPPGRAEAAQLLARAVRRAAERAVRGAVHDAQRVRLQRRPQGSRDGRVHRERRGVRRGRVPE